MQDDHRAKYWEGYRDALRDIMHQAKASQTFNELEELNRLIADLWRDRIDMEEL